ncbi:MAG: succinate dehydrogenase/fumarate reductase iron-sulfur subunit [Myxococcota bacterium]
METRTLTLHVWRQNGPSGTGSFQTYEATDVNEHMSFLEMLDDLNEKLIGRGEEEITFDHDCREGICGSCGMVVNGYAHGPRQRTTTCQLHMREVFKLGWTEIWVEPWRAKAFPLIKDLMVDRAAFDRIQHAGGYISVRTGAARDANETPVQKQVADSAMDAATCIGCGACVASCPNASASLFTSAKVGHLGTLPQGQPERDDRVRRMVAQMDAEGFGSCTNHGECEAACPKGISVDWIARMNREFVRAMVTAKDEVDARD